jgi:hypothetical protein
MTSGQDVSEYLDILGLVKSYFFKFFWHDGNIVLTTTIGLLTLYHLCLLLLVRLGGYIVNLSDFYSYRLIGKLTAFLQLQEFSLRNLPVASSTSVARLSLNSSNTKLAWLSLRRQLYILILT